MKPVLVGTIAVVLCCQLIAPVGASAQSWTDTSPPASPQAPQGAPTGKSSAPGGRFLGNVLIGAAIGGTLTGIMAHALDDCGNCGPDTKAIASGAMYGALVGAAINIRPSRRPWPSRRRTTISSQLTREVKSVNVAVRF